MTPEQESKLNELTLFMESMKAGFSFPKQVEDSIRDRLGGSIVATGTGSVSGATTYSSFDVVVPASASGTLKVNVGGVDYELLYK